MYGAMGFIKTQKKVTQTITDFYFVQCFILYYYWLLTSEFFL